MVREIGTKEALIKEKKGVHQQTSRREKMRQWSNEKEGGKMNLWRNGTEWKKKSGNFYENKRILKEKKNIVFEPKNKETYKEAGKRRRSDLREEIR